MSAETPVKKIVSGGQTGVDRAGLDFALERGLEHGGWCPKGRLAEDGEVPARYMLRETPTEEYARRTEWNVRDSDATLIVSPLPLKGGTRLTERVALGYKPCLVVDPARDTAAAELSAWLSEVRPKTLNVAGPRASQWPDGYRKTLELLRAALK